MSTLIVGCGHHEPPSAGAPDALGDVGDPSLDAPGGAIDAGGTGGDAMIDGTSVTGGDAMMIDGGGNTDAGCWSCGLPTGAVGSTVELGQPDCIIHFMPTGYTYSIADRIFVVLRGTSPSALSVDVQINIADKLVCSSPVASDGSWHCTEHSIYNSAIASGQITGTTFTASWFWEETDYMLTCPMLSGTLQ